MKVLVTNIFGKENKGDQVLFETLIYFLLSKKSIDEISLMAHYTEGLTEYSEKIKLYKPVNNMQISGKLKAIFIPFILIFSYLYTKIPLFGLFLTKWQKESINSYKDVDLVISCPGGFLEDSTKSYFASIFQIFLAISFKKEVIIAPQSIGPIRGKFSKYLLKKTLQKVKKIYTRETYSYKFVVNELQIDSSKVQMSADMAFFYSEYKKFELSNTKEEYLFYSILKYR
jgi:colanic acid/amylovoran biosynthesis protein